MKVNLKYSLGYYVQKVDLEAYGYDKNITWESLTEDQQHKITDRMLDEMVIYVDGETID